MLALLTTGSLNFTGSQLGLSYIPEGDAVSQATLAEPEEEKRTSLFIIGNNHDLKVWYKLCLWGGGRTISLIIM